jgi:ATP-dependent DNA ligase
MLRSGRVPVAGAPFFGPCLPSPARDPPTGSDWLHEIKFDGYRALIRRDGNGVRLFTGRGYDWTSRFPAIVNAAEAIVRRMLPNCREMCGCNDGFAVPRRLA